MTGKAQTHETGTTIGKTAFTEFTAGADITLKVRVKCPDFCDLRGKIVKIIDQDAVVQEIELTEYNSVGNGADTFVVHLPDKPGLYTWTAVFPAQDQKGNLHQESSAQFSFIFKPHAISIAVWDAPSPVVMNSKFKIKVGVKCSANCELTGKEIEICDQEGAMVGTGTLGGTPWSATRDKLYGTEVELDAPSTEGLNKWTVKFPEPDMELPHEAASYTFAFSTAKQPEHIVTVEVLDKATKAPIKNAHVVLHPYNGDTDASGMARVNVPPGEYKLYASQNDYETFRTTISVASDMAIKAELVIPHALVQDA